MSVLFALNSEEYVCRKVCHPICCVIPTFAAAGPIMVRIRHWPQYGLCPRAAGLANTQSSASGRISDARTEITARLEKLKEHPILHGEEHRAIEYAITSLGALEREEEQLAAEDEPRGMHGSRRG